MVRSGLGRLPLDQLDLLLIENVGNLVCPAEFDVGQHARAMVYAITEGEEKPLKYPVMFHACDVVVVNKIDLLPHLDFDLDRFLANLRAVNPTARLIHLSARTGEGVEEWCDWLLEAAARRLSRAQPVCRPPRRRGAGGDGEADGGRGAGQRAGVVPQRPRHPVRLPGAGCARAVRGDQGQGVVVGDVVPGRDPDADEVRAGAHHGPHRPRLVEVAHRQDRGCGAGDRGAEQHGHEQRVGSGPVDGLHGGEALAGGQVAEGRASRRSRSRRTPRRRGPRRRRRPGSGCGSRCRGWSCHQWTPDR